MPGRKTVFATLYIVLKNELKARSITYRDVAHALNTTQSSIKMRFAHRNLSLAQFIAIAELLGMTLTDLMRKVESPNIEQYTPEQEIALVKDLRLLLVFTEVMDDRSAAEIVAAYDITEAQCIKYLLELDRLRLIDLLPNNIVRKRMRRGAAWQPNGPLQRLITSQISDYLDSRFYQPHERVILSRASLTDAAISVLQTDMRHLQNRVEILHEECKSAPIEQRRHIVLLAAEQEWDLPAFKKLQRKPRRQDVIPS